LGQQQSALSGNSSGRHFFAFSAVLEAAAAAAAEVAVSVAVVDLASLSFAVVVAVAFVAGSVAVCHASVFPETAAIEHPVASPLNSPTTMPSLVQTP